jgi:hypothetical protein
VVNKNWILSFAAAMQMIADGASHRKIIFGCALLAPVLSICFVRIYQLLSQRDTKAGMQHFSGGVRSATDGECSATHYSRIQFFNRRRCRPVISSQELTIQLAVYQNTHTHLAATAYR